jgi:hypothetical protein
MIMTVVSLDDEQKKNLRGR